MADEKSVPVANDEVHEIGNDELRANPIKNVDLSRNLDAKYESLILQDNAKS